MSYVGVPPFGQTVRTITEKIAQQDQTIFYPDGGYIPGYVDIELDGADLGSQDFTATDGLSVVLAQKAGAGSLFRSKAFWPVAMQDTMRRAEINAIVGAGNWAMRNRLINGDMRIDQRNAGASVTANTNTYGVDRWKCDMVASSKGTVQQTPNATETGYAARVAAGFTSYLAFTSSAATTVGSTDYYSLIQAVEGLNVADLAWGTSSAKTVTLSFWAYSSLTGTFGGSIQNSAYSRSYPFSYSIPTANTWTQITVTIAGDQSGAWLITNGVGLRVRFSLGSGSTLSGTAGAWAAGDVESVTGAVSVVGTSGATFYITGIQLEKGSYATPFDFRPYGAELTLCQRYLPSIVTAASGADVYMGQAYSSAYSVIAIPLPVTARVPPTGLTTTVAASNWSLLSSAGGGISLINLSFNRGGTNSVGLTAQVASGLTGGNATWFMCPSSGALLLTGCEL